MTHKRKILVTGGAGFIGSNFVHYWKENAPDDKIVVIDSLTYAGNKDNLASLEGTDNFVFVHGDICDTALVERLLKEHKLNTIVHFAAESHVDRSISDPDAFVNTNIVGTYSLLQAAKRVWIDEAELAGEEVFEHHFHHVSTDEVYGTLAPSDSPFVEITPYAPNSPYSASKAASDHLVRAYHHTFGLKVTTSNCSNNYGYYHFPEKLIPLVITNILKNKKLPIYGDGKQIRDWLYVEDHVRGIELVLSKGLSGETYNIGGNNEWTNVDIVKLVCETMDRQFAENEALSTQYKEAKLAITGKSRELITFVEDRAGHDRRYAVDASKSEQELGYSPKYTFETGIRKTISWYLNNSDWWTPLLKE